MGPRRFYRLRLQKPARILHRLPRRQPLLRLRLRHPEDSMSDPAAEQGSGPSSGGFWRVMIRELRILAGDPLYFFLLVILPVGAMVLFVVVFTNPIPRDAPVLVCDEDHSELSRKLTRMMDASATLRVTGTVLDMQEGTRAIRTGKAYALLFIPKAWERDILHGDSPAVTIFYNNQWLLVSGVISRAARDVAAAMSLGTEIKFRMAQGELPDIAFSKADPIRADVHVLFNPGLSYRDYLIPALFATLLQAFITMITVRSIGTELRKGTMLEWLAAAGGRTWLAVAGKLFPHTVFFVAMMMFSYMLQVNVLHIPIRGYAWVLALASLLYVLAYQAMGFFFIGFFGNFRLAGSMAGFYCGPAFAFAGVTYPYIGMPLFAKVWGCGLPLTYYVSLMFQQILRGSPPQASAGSVGAIFLFVVIPPLLVWPRFRRLMRDPACWGGS